MAMRWQMAVLAGLAIMTGCGDSASTTSNSGGAFAATGGLVSGTGATVAAAGDPNCVTTPGAGPDATGCSLALQCTDVSAGLVVGGLNYCACSNTGRPPTCDTDPNVCAAYPGTSCMALPGIGSFCAVTCTPPATAGTGGVVTTGGIVGGTGGVVTTTGGTMAGPDPACVSDTAATDGSECTVGLKCTDPTSTGSFICSCPNTSLPPPCTTVGSTTECAAYPGTACTEFSGLGTYCAMSCVVPGSAPVTCPAGLTCGDPLSLGMPSCLADGAIQPPTCASAADCAAYEGTMCITLPVVAAMGCYKSCTL